MAKAVTYSECFDVLTKVVDAVREEAVTKIGASDENKSDYALGYLTAFVSSLIGRMPAKEQESIMRDLRRGFGL